LTTEQPNKPKHVIWKPTPGAQQLAVSCTADRILLSGGRGSGKSEAQLFHFRKLVGIGYGPYLRGVICNRSYKSLQNLIERSKFWFNQFDDGAIFLESSSQLRWKFPSGEQLAFRVLNDENDYWGMHGHEIPWQGFDEVTRYENLDLIDKMGSLCRCSFVPELHSPKDENGKPLLPPMPLQQVLTTNPSGVGFNAVKKRFIEPARFGELVKIDTEVFNPRTKKTEIITKTQVALHSSYKDNPFLSPEYIADLENIEDPNLKKAWLSGSWEAVSGELLSDCWKPEHNIIKNFTPPPGYKLFRCFDWGSSSPACAAVFAESDGSPIRFNDDSIMHTVKGDLIYLAENYMWSGQPNKGLKLLPSQIAMSIIRHEVSLGEGIHERIKPGFADSTIFYDGTTGSSVAMDMAQTECVIAGRRYGGPQYIPADKRPGSRLAGLLKIRTALVQAWPNEDGSARTKPGLFVTEVCQDGFIRTVPTLARDPKNPDDCSKLAEDHCYDTLRYCLNGMGGRFENKQRVTMGHY